MAEECKQIKGVDMDCPQGVKLLVIIWTFVGLGLSLYLICFPVFIKKKIASIVDLLQRILNVLEQKK